MHQQVESKNLHLDAGPHAVLLIHGMGANIIEITRLAQALHAAGFSVFAADIQGFCHGMPVSQWESWLKQVIGHFHALRQRYDTVSVVGVSMGATLALALAERERPDSLVLLSTALAYDGWGLPWYHFLLKMLPLVPFKNRYRYRETEPYGVKNLEVRTMVKRALQSDQVSEMGGESMSLQHIVQGRRLIAHVREHIAAVSSPTLLMHAVEDETVSVRHAEWVFEHIASANKDIIYLGDSYHMITIDNERDTVMHETERFIKRTLNAVLPAPAFELAPILSRELRRLLKGAGKPSMQD
jgi:carboxylesterase